MTAMVGPGLPWLERSVMVSPNPEMVVKDCHGWLCVVKDDQDDQLWSRRSRVVKDGHR